MGAMARPVRWLVLATTAVVAAAVTQIVLEAVGPALTIPARPGSEATTALPVAVTASVSAVSALAALVGTTVLSRLTTRAVPIAVALGLVMLALSMVPIVSVWSQIASPWGLVALHLVVAAVVLAGLPGAVGPGLRRTTSTGAAPA